MKLTFLGTRGNIKARTKKHYRHSSMLVSCSRKTIMIDCGRDWLKKVFEINPDAILITHAHPDHAEGLKHGAPCPVYATLETWNVIKHYPIEDRRIIVPKKPLPIEGMMIEAFDVVHSLNAPAVGYRITAGSATIFYVPDLVNIKHQAQALQSIDLYIGDGAIISRRILVKKRGKIFIGHSPISVQLTWCKKQKVKYAIFTHCGTEIVTGNEQEINKKISMLAKKYSVHVTLAYDGLAITI
jgi:phosphoribosyl 1,2-cyclic phosphodiesterase